MAVINLTTHKITILSDDGPIEISASGSVARVSTDYKMSSMMDGVRICKTEYGPVEGLPDPAPDTFYLVSNLVRLALPERKDLLAPGELVRDPAGIPMGCSCLITN